MKIVRALVGAAIALSLIAGAAPADATSSPGSVTYLEYLQARYGMTKRHIQRDLWDAQGRLTDEWTDGAGRDHRTKTYPTPFPHQRVVASYVLRHDNDGDNRHGHHNDVLHYRLEALAWCTPSHCWRPYTRTGPTL